MNETIINRTPETFGQQIEKARLESIASATQASSNESVTTNVAEVVSAPTAPQTAEGQRAGSVGMATEWYPDSELVKLTRELVKVKTPSSFLFEEFGEFREKVIAAFKHLGLDTNKHFGV
jgi:hypothetical protein